MILLLQAVFVEAILFFLFWFNQIIFEGLVAVILLIIVYWISTYINYLSSRGISSEKS